MLFAGSSNKIYLQSYIQLQVMKIEMKAGNNLKQYLSDLI
jgi:hypothetical protein